MKGILSIAFFEVGGAFAAPLLALLSVAGWNHREASKLESATARLSQNKTQTVVDAALISAISALPLGLQALNKQQRDSPYPPMDAHAKLDPPDVMTASSGQLGDANTTSSTEMHVPNPENREVTPWHTDSVA